jgi:hypothetical protein
VRVRRGDRGRDASAVAEGQQRRVGAPRKRSSTIWSARSSPAVGSRGTSACSPPKMTKGSPGPETSALDQMPHQSPLTSMTLPGVRLGIAVERKRLGECLLTVRWPPLPPSVQETPREALNE